MMNNFKIVGPLYSTYQSKVRFHGICRQIVNDVVYQTGLAVFGATLLPVVHSRYIRTVSSKNTVILPDLQLRGN